MSLKLIYFEIGGLAESIRYILHYTGKKFEDVRYDYSKWPIPEVKEGLPFGKMPLLEVNGRTLHQSIAIARYVATGTELLPSDPWEQAVLDATVLTFYDFMKEMTPYFEEKDPVKKEEHKKKFLEVQCLPFGKMPLLEVNGRTLHQSIAIARYVATGTELLPSDPWEQAVLDATVLTFYDFMKEMTPYFEEKDPVKKEEHKKKFLEVQCEFFLSRFEKQVKANNGYFGGKLSWADFMFVGLFEVVNMYCNTNVTKNYPGLGALLQKIPSLPGVKQYIATRKPYTVNN